MTRALDKGVRRETVAGEVWLAYTHAEPAALRVEFSPVFVAIRRQSVHRS